MPLSSDRRCPRPRNPMSFLAIPALVVLAALLPWPTPLPTTAAPADGAARPSARVTALIEAERAFSEMSRMQGVRDSFLHWMAPDAVIFRPGPVNARTFYTGRPASPAVLTWEPTRVELSADGTLGLSTGPWQVRRDAAAEPGGFGHFISVWKKQPDGAWRVAIDVGCSYDATERQTEALSWSEGATLRDPDGDGKGTASTTLNRKGLMLADDNFVADAARTGLAKAAEKRLARDARVYRDGEFPAIGRDAALKRLARDRGRLSWRVLGADVSGSGDFGYTYGMAAFYPDAAGAPPDSSCYLRVWRRGASHEWQLVLDILSPLPAPPVAKVAGSGSTGAPAAPAPVSRLPLSETRASATALLPPELPWNGASRALIAKAGDPWVTPAEASGLTTTPRYDETVAWLRRLEAADDRVALISLGRSPEGRDIWLVSVTAEGATTPAALRANGRPTFLAQAGIHAGEIDGKDAGMMFLRDLTVRGTKSGLLDRANFLFIPILNVDGHERFGPFGRVNQRGPVECGWRTTARNLNLNRDYAKVDAPEMRALIRALNDWAPDLYYDIHVTDGIDYQYDITFGYTGTHGYSPYAAGWMDLNLAPALFHDLKAAGHVPGRLIFAAGATMEEGLFDWTAGPRFSNAYGDLRHLPTLLIENHSLKPYRQRVLGTYVLLESTLRLLGRLGHELRTASVADAARRPAAMPLSWRTGPGDTAQVQFLGVTSRQVPSSVTGAERTEWLGRPVTMTIPLFRQRTVATSVTRPRAYWIPPQWTEAIDRLRVHGLAMETLTAPRTLSVEMYRIDEPKLDGRAFEGRVQVTGRPVVEVRTRTFPAGSVRVATDQPLGDLAVVLLEPQSDDSFFRWGFFPEILSETEYVEEYVMEPMARAMLAEDPALRARFDAALAADSLLAKSPGARLRWFYRQTPFRDDAWRLYPVAREVAP